MCVRDLILNHGNAVHIINFAEIAYHQNEVLYIIIAKAHTPSVMIYSLTADVIHPSGDDMPLLLQWIKKDDSKESSFLELVTRIELATCSLRMSCSAIEPHQHIILCESYYTSYKNKNQGKVYVYFCT